MPAAARGPVPKRRNELLGHRSKADLADVDTVRMVGIVKPPGIPKDLHPTAKRWYRALRRSAQAHYYEPSDWALAVFVAEQMSLILKGGAAVWTANAFTAVMKASESLLVTEGARRRVRIEAERVPSGADTGEKPRSISDHRDRAGS